MRYRQAVSAEFAFQPFPGESLRENEACPARPQVQRRVGAPMPHSHRDHHSRAVGGAERDPPPGVEDHLPAASHFETDLHEPSGECPSAVPEAVKVNVGMLPVGRAEDRAEELALAVPQLDRGVLGERIEERRRHSSVDRVDAYPVAVCLGLWLKPQGTEAERRRLRTAGGIFEVDQAVVGVVSASAADWPLRRQRRGRE